MAQIGKFLMLAAFFIFLTGLGIYFLGKMHFIGKCPWFDICIKRKNFFFYFPVGSALIASLILSLILKILAKK
jgi:hypothetical protein